MKITKQVWLVHDLSTNEEYVSSMGPPYSDPDCYDLAGPVSVEFDVPDVARCPHCNKPLPEPEKPKLPLLPLVVGGVYRTRTGDQVKLISNDGHHEYPWEDECGEGYTNDGHLLMNEVCSGDLIERIA